MAMQKKKRGGFDAVTGIAAQLGKKRDRDRERVKEQKQRNFEVYCN